jgi:hypothetical protein
VVIVPEATSRIKLHLGRETTLLALLIYATTPEAIFYQMQFVRQNFAIVLFTSMLYLLCVLFNHGLDRRYGAIMLVSALLVVPAHHFTSFTTALFLTLLSAFVALGKYLGKFKTLRRLFWPSPKVSFLGIALGLSIFMFVWWDSFGTVVWSTVESRISRFVRVWEGMQFQLWAPTASYPEALRPAWVPPLLRLRDFIMYIPAFFGFLIMWNRKTGLPERFFLLYYALAFGLIFFVDDIFFALEPFRVILLSMPLVAFLSSLFYNKIQEFSKVAWRATIFFITVLLVFSSFVGLWAHDFAPAHLYDPSISAIEMGEVTPYYTRIRPFFEKRIVIDDIQTVWAESFSLPLYFLEPEQYDKINRLPTENFGRIGRKGIELVCSVTNLNMYRYFGWIWGHPRDIQEAKSLQSELRRYLDHDTRIYDDGRNVLWITEDRAS